MSTNQTKGATCADVALAVRSDLVRRKLKIIDVAKLIGIDPGLVSMHLNGKNRMRPKTASLYSDALGYNVDYLTSGHGSLFEKFYETNDETAINKDASPLVDSAYFKTLKELINSQRETIDAQKSLIDKLTAALREE